MCRKIQNSHAKKPEMVVVSIDERDANRRTLQRARGVEAAEAAAYDHDVTGWHQGFGIRGWGFGIRDSGFGAVTMLSYLHDHSGET